MIVKVNDSRFERNQNYNVVLSVWSYMLVKFNCTHQAISDRINAPKAALQLFYKTYHKKNVLPVLCNNILSIIFHVYVLSKHCAIFVKRGDRSQQ